MKPSPRLRLIPLALLVGAVTLTTGCNDKTINITQPAATSLATPTTSTGATAPEGTTTPEEAKKLIEAAYREGFEQSFEEALKEATEERREELRKRRRMQGARHRHWIRRIRRHEMIKILNEKHSSRFTELVKAWEKANPGRSFECEKPLPPPPGEVEIKIEPVEEAKVCPPESTEEGSDNLACWRKLCPALDELIRRHSGYRTGFRQGFRQGFQAGLQAGLQSAPASELPSDEADLDSATTTTEEEEDSSETGDIDVSDMGVTLPTSDIEQAALQALLDQARENGRTAGKAAATEEVDEQAAERSERHKKWIASLRERVAKYLPKQIEKALSKCSPDKDCDSDCPEGGLLVQDGSK